MLLIIKKYVTVYFIANFRKWIDTCCIDNSSSAELSEAINSMFRWYEKAEVCYVYLLDVPSAPEDPYLWNSVFRRSECFTRGWTLQELLAPYYVDFFDQSWNWIGSKSGLDGLIGDTTRVRDLLNYKAASVAQKMSWASRRETTRMEDKAYCLLGLFGVYMPPLHGEGDNAFLRLQLEIISKTDDDSIFAWCGAGDLGLLAQSPFDFADSSAIVRAVWDLECPPHSMTNKGLCVHFQLIPTRKSDNASTMTFEFLALLNCVEKGPNGEIDPKSVIALTMCQVSSDQTWSRAHAFNIFDFNSEAISYLGTQRTMIYVRQTSVLDVVLTTIMAPFRHIRVIVDSLFAIGFKVRDRMVRESSACWTDEIYGLLLTVLYEPGENLRASVILGGFTDPVAEVTFDREGRLRWPVHNTRKAD
jgi:hypothetical protein